MLNKILVLFTHLIMLSLWIMFAFLVFGDQWWIPHWIAVAIIGFGMYFLFSVAFLIAMEYFDERGDFTLYDEEDDE